MTGPSDQPLSWHVEQHLATDMGHLAASSLATYRTNLRGVLRCLAVVDEPNLVRRPVSVVDDVAKTLHVDLLTVENLRAAFEKMQAGAFRSRSAGVPRSNASMRIVWSATNGLCSRLTRIGVLAGNPMAGVDKAALLPYQPTALHRIDYRALLAAAAEPPRGRIRIRWPLRDVAIIGTSLFLGARASEITSLTVGAIGGKPGSTFMHIEDGGLSPRMLPVPAELEDALFQYLDERVTGAPLSGQKPALSRGRQPDSFSGHQWWRILKREPLFVSTTGEPMNRTHMFRVIEYVYEQAGLTEETHGANGVLQVLRNTFIHELNEAGTSRDEMESLLGYAPLNRDQRDCRNFRTSPTLI